MPTGRPDPSCQLEIQCLRPETAEVTVISAVLGTIPGGQNIDSQWFCKVFSGLSALQEMRSKNK